ncbi:hypothetical protein HK14_02125 [Acetobacter cibinongensis]|uniref:Uncharacterized protein n=1 Tax=Acetobacter cibinongensis TaxID=146475 RepID=A0A1Z5YWF3_9PROT|nr:hypothetical protein HK14_02125 [Acetobacter cibinongensis]
MYEAQRLCLVTIVASVPNDYFYLIGEVYQKHVGVSEATGLPHSEIKTDRSALIIAHGIKF